jgi:hypothetical protein
MTGHLVIDAILHRAERYRHETYARLGSPPETFLVTEAEYALLQRWTPPRGVLFLRDDIPDYVAPRMSIFGMRVIKPERFLWYRDSVYMEHFKHSPLAGEPIAAWGPFWSLPEAISRCRTERPDGNQRTITCPCGEVIWDLSMYTWDALLSVFWDVPRVVDPTLDMRLVRISDDEPSPSQVVDSERSSFAEWSAQVDALLADSEPRGDELEVS